MAINTPIEWTDDTVNPTTGCDGCELWNSANEFCYAGNITRRYGASNPGLADDFNVVSVAPNRMREAVARSDRRGEKRPSKPWLDSLPRLIFVGDMSDTFSCPVSFEYLRDEIISSVRSDAGQRHQFQWLTKQPQRMAEFSDWLSNQSITWPANLWVGTSVTTQATGARISHLADVGDDDTIRFVSVEPQWEEVDLDRWLPDLNWVIQGGHSGRGSRDHVFAVEWADALRQQCAEHRVAYFLKQLGTCVTEGGARLRGQRGKRSDWSAWPRRLRVRQMPIFVGRRRRRTIRQTRV